ncbi:MAG: DUF6232 family protein [Chryseolinea sp.]
MEQNKFLYSDGKEVFVTQSTLQTKKKLYRLKGITDFGLSVLRPNRIPGLIVFIIGAVIAADGYLYFLPASFFEFLSIPTAYSQSNVLIPIGIFIAVIGLGLMVLMRKRYAVRIETAEGKKDAVVSKRKEYVDLILNAMRKGKSSTASRR